MLFFSLLVPTSTSNTIRGWLWRPSPMKVQLFSRQHLSFTMMNFFFAARKKTNGLPKKKKPAPSVTWNDKRLLNKDFSLSSRMSLGRHTSQTCRTSEKKVIVCIHIFWISAAATPSPSSSRHKMKNVFRKLDGAKLTSWTKQQQSSWSHELVERERRVEREK